MENTAHTVKVCTSGKCKGKGSPAIAETLTQGCAGCATVTTTDDCFGDCGMGPNVAVDGNILHHMNPRDAVAHVKEELAHPSKKVHGLGGKTLDDLDSVLDDLI